MVTPPPFVFAAMIVATVPLRSDLISRIDVQIDVLRPARKPIFVSECSDPFY
jgi:hypothetical protein